MASIAPPSMWTVLICLRKSISSYRQLVTMLGVTAMSRTVTYLTPAGTVYVYSYLLNPDVNGALTASAVLPVLVTVLSVGFVLYSLMTTRLPTVVADPALAEEATDHVSPAVTGMRFEAICAFSVGPTLLIRRQRLPCVPLLLSNCQSHTVPELPGYFAHGDSTWRPSNDGSITMFSDCVQKTSSLPAVMAPAASWSVPMAPAAMSTAAIVFAAICVLVIVPVAISDAVMVFAAISAPVMVLPEMFVAVIV